MKIVHIILFVLLFDNLFSQNTAITGGTTGALVNGIDISGTKDNMKVIGIRHIPIAPIIPTLNQILKYNGVSYTPSLISFNELTNKPSLIDADTLSTNEIQDLSIVGDQLSLSLSNTITLPSYTHPSYTSTTQGSATNVPVITVDALGHVSSLSSVLVQGETTKVLDGSTIDFTLSVDTIKGEVKNGSIVPSKLDRVYLESVPSTYTTDSELVNAILTSDIADGDKEDNNEIQSISLVGQTLSLSLGGGSVVIPDIDTDTDDQTLSISGDNISISEGNTITLPSEIDASISNELQSLSIVGNNLTISSGNTVALPVDNDGSSTNELQTLSIIGQDINLSNSGGTITIPSDGDGSSTNEIQSLSIAGEIISLTSGGSINLPTVVDNSITNEIQTLSISGNSLSISEGNSIALPSEVDGSITNELQSLSLVGNDLTISSGNTITLPVDGDGSSTNEIQTLSIVGQDVTLSNGGGVISIPLDGDGSSTNEIQTLTAGTNISVVPSGINYTITNSAPDVPVVLTGTGSTTVTGTYPNFTINSTSITPIHTTTVANQAISVITSTNLTNLSLPVTAGVFYQFEAYILYNAAATTTGLGLGLTFPTGSIMNIVNIPINATTDLQRNFINSTTIALATGSPATTNNVAYISGQITPTVNGTLQIVGRSEINGSAITILPNSKLTLIPF